MRFKMSSTGASASTTATESEQDVPAPTSAAQPGPDKAHEAKATEAEASEAKPEAPSPKPPTPGIATTIGTISARNVDSVRTARFADHEVPTASVPIDDSASDMPEAILESTNRATLALSILCGLLVGIILGLVVRHLLL